MFTRHTAEFANITSENAVNGALLNLSADTMLETTRGWMPVCELAPGDSLATLDGGFARIAWVHRSTAAEPGLFVPAGVLDNCSDLVLPASTRIGITAPIDFDAETDTLSVPLSAFEGTKGIKRHVATVDTFSVGLETEEMVWAQTGMLIHARPMSNPYFHALSFAEARALLALDHAGYFGQTRAA